jgi:hypothetical protein
MATSADGTHRGVILQRVVTQIREVIKIVWRFGSKPTRRPGPGRRPPAGLRLALLSLATVILLLGAVIAGVFCYETIGHVPAHGGSAGAATDVGMVSAIMLVRTTADNGRRPPGQ